MLTQAKCSHDKIFQAVEFAFSKTLHQKLLCVNKESFHLRPQSLPKIFACTVVAAELGSSICGSCLRQVQQDFQCQICKFAVSRVLDIKFHLTLGWTFLTSTSPSEPTKPSGDAPWNGCFSEMKNPHCCTVFPVHSEYFWMIPCSEASPSSIKEVLEKEFMHIISFIALVGLVVGLIKARLHFEAVMRGRLCLYQASLFAWFLVCFSICLISSWETNNFFLILSALSLISVKETGWHLGGEIRSSSCSHDLEAVSYWVVSSCTLHSVSSISTSRQNGTSMLFTGPSPLSVSWLKSQVVDVEFVVGKPIKWKIGGRQSLLFADKMSFFSLIFLSKCSAAEISNLKSLSAKLAEGLIPFAAGSVPNLAL